MPACRIAFVGAGSYVFGPALLHDLFVRNRLDDVELALIDVNRDAVELMAAVARRAVEGEGLRARVETATERPRALEGADFVVCSAAAQMQARFAEDCRIIAAHDPAHLATEFGGVAGISCSLRQMAMIDAVGADMRAACPRAWLLDVANPLPRVCQYAHESGIATAGFCSVSTQAHQSIWALLHGASIAHPFAASTQRYEATLAGVNHLCWLVRLIERETGADALPALREAASAGRSCGNPRVDRLLRETGYLLATHDGHTHDFFAPMPGESVSLASTSHGSADQRDARLRLLRDVAEGREPHRRAFDKLAWEHPGDFIRAMVGGREVRLHSLNLVNRGQIPQLPGDVFVETACAVDGEGPRPDRVDLPPEVVPLTRRTAAVTDAIVRAARQRRRGLVHVAVEMDPLIVDKARGRAAVDDCLAAHADLIGPYR